MSHVTHTMLPAFLAQFSAGCFLVISVSAMRQSGWKYLRLMALVSMGLSAAAFLMVAREADWRLTGAFRTAAAGLGAAVVFAMAWLFVNAAQREGVRASQRLWPAVAGVCGLMAAIALVLRRDVMLSASIPPAGAMGQVAIAATTALGGLLLGSVTCAMLLGHRYLTDTDMPIAPLRRLAKIYLGVLVVRFAWIAALSWPLWSGAFQPRGDWMWFWLMICVRVGVGVVGLGVFAWMAWDCVKRRATQSATAIFYLSMIFAFLGELAGQYLTRTESMAL